MRLLIIRHADPDYSKDSLTEVGFREAAQLSERLKKENITKIYCSPLGRAQKTAEPTANVAGLEIETLDWLREVPAGVKPPYKDRHICPWELMPDFWTKEDNAFDKEKWTEMPVFAESKVPEVWQTVRKGCDELLAKHGYVRESAIYKCEENEENPETVALFCHMGLGLFLLAHLLNIPATVAWHNFFISPSSVTAVLFEARKKGTAIPKCLYMGDTSHVYAAGYEFSTMGLQANLK